MGIDVLRSQIIERIQNADESFLRILDAMTAAYEAEQREEIIGYQIGTNDPILASEADDTFEAIVEDVKKGNYIEIDDLIAKRSARW